MELLIRYLELGAVIGPALVLIQLTDENARRAAFYGLSYAWASAAFALMIVLVWLIWPVTLLAVLGRLVRSW